MRAATLFVPALLVAALLPGSVAAQGHPAHAGEGLGAVHFSTSCRTAVAPAFNRAVALLHSFEFGAAISGFEDVLAADPTCAMAHWGIALARWTNPMSLGNRAPQVLALGRSAADAAARLAVGATDRERTYIAAVYRLYADYEQVDQSTRVAAYEHAMADLVAEHTDDDEAKIFHAIALVATAAPSDKTYARQREAGAVLESLWASQPDHPGVAHYIIHAYDVPALATLSAAAARRYAEIAPAAAHALHMPSHTFTRLGMWEASVETNRRSAEAAMRDSSVAEILHASDYMAYAYLQLQRDAEAEGVLAGLPELASRFDPHVIRGAAPGSAGVFALAAIPARYALERRAWTEAAALVPTASSFPYAEAMTYFARALGAAHLVDMAMAREAVDSLAVIHTRLLAQGEPYWAEQVEIQRLGALAWLNLAEGRTDDAITHQSEAARREDATEKSAVSPGPLAPARELLGDMLLELGRFPEALAEYRATLTREPNRFRALEGAMRAATAAGDHVSAAAYAAQLASLTGRQRE